MKKSFNDILGQMQQAPLRKVLEKVPSWNGRDGLEVPGKLCSEQCSSENTAIYKSKLAFKAAHGSSDCRIADLTGGLGVDCWAFSQLFSKVLYNERDTALSKAGASNFKLLGCSNVEVQNNDFNAENASFLKDFQPDIIYLDPARRASSGKKVFRLEDCEPDVNKLMPLLQEICRFVLLKLSPMADISAICKELGPQVKEIHCLSSGGEMKEILVLLDFRSQPVAEPLIVATDTINRIEFHHSEESICEAVFTDEIATGHYLYEPDPAILKAGAFKLPCKLYGIRKIAPSTHLYISKKNIPFGKCHLIDEVLPFDKRAMASLKERFGKAEITARNLPLNSEELRKKMGVPQGGDVHIFAFSALLTGRECRRMIISRDI